MSALKQENTSLNKSDLLRQCLQGMLRDSQVALAYCRQMKLTHKMDTLLRQTQTLQTCLRFVGQNKDAATVVETLQAANQLLAEQLKKCLATAKEKGMLSPP